MSTPAAQSWTLTDFLAWENAQPDERHEFIAGRIVAMKGAREDHNQRTQALNVALCLQVKPPCRVYTHVMRVVVGEDSFYPDIVLTCGEFKNATELIDADLIIEVTSPSTRRKDETVKVDAYLTLPSLKAYVIVSPDSVRAYTREADRPWLQSDYRSVADVPLPLGLTLEHA